MIYNEIISEIVRFFIQPALYGFYYFLIFFVGASIGTIVTTIIQRDKLNETIFKMPFCTQCKKRLNFINTIPFFSYLYQRGKCEQCGSRIPPMNIIIEISTGLYAVIIFAFYGFTPYLLKFLTFYLIVFPISYVDTHHSAIRTRFIILGAFLIFAYSLIFEINNINNVVLGGFIGFAFFYIVHKIFKEKFSVSNVRLMGLLGLFSGLEGIFWTIMLASLMGIIYSLIWIIIKHHTHRMRIPLSPFLSTGTFLYLTIGEYLKAILSTSFM